MLFKLAFVLVAVSLASAQILPGGFQSFGGQTVQLIPVGGIGGAQQIGLSGARFGIGAAPVGAQFLIGGAAPAANLQLIRQPAPQVQFISAPQPATQFVSVAQPQPRIQLVSAPAPQPVTIQAAPAPAPQPIRITAPAPAPAPAPQPIRITAPAPAPQPPRALAASSSNEEGDDYYIPGTPVAPYAFSFDETDEYGMNLQRQEVSENGIVTGQYSFTTPEGYTRVVKYVSDELGFRAQVQTNEPGTLTSAPADAEYQSSAQPPAPSRR